MSREEGFDRERILEWLLNVPSAADPHQPSSELDRGSTFDPNSTPVSTPPTPASQQHHHQQQQQQNKPQKLHHRMTSPLIQRHQQRRMPSPVVLTSLTQHGTERALSLGSLPVSERRSRDGKMNVTFTQSRDHLASFLRKKKSGSPLPDTQKDPELPTFTPRPPSLPGTRTLVKQTSRSDASVADHLLRTSPTSLRATLEEEQPTSQRPCTKEGVDDSPLPPCFSGRQEQPPHFTTHTTDREDEDNSKIHQHSLLDSYRTDSTSGSHSTHYDCVSAVTEYVAPPIEDLVLATPSTMPLGNKEEGEGEEREENEGEGEEEEERERCAPLSSVELATLSLHVVDILPQLAVYLSMDYSQYEHIISSESSPQRQSMAVLMAWYRSGTRRRGRWELARALQQFGEEYSRTAQLLLRGELEESGHTLQDLEGLSLSRRSVSSSASPTSAPHHPCSPSPLPPPPTSTSHLSPEHKPHTVPPPSSSSPSPSPHHPLSTQARKLKQGFTFDEDQVSHDPLPKFLSSRTLQTSSPDSPHHQSPLLPHSHMLHSLPVQHQTSLSEVRSVSSSSLPPPAPELPGHAPRVLTIGRRTISLQNDDMLQFGGRSRQKLRGSYSSGRLHRSSLQSVDILREVDSSRLCESTGNIVRESSGREEMVMIKSQVGSAELGRECSGKISRPADSHCVESGTHSSEPLEAQQSFAIGSQTPAKHTVQQPRTNPGSRHLSIIGSQLSLPMSSTSSHYRKSGVGKARLQETAVAGTVIKQEVWSPTPRGDGGNTRQKMKRQDSGIETLAST